MRTIHTFFLTLLAYALPYSAHAETLAEFIQNRVLVLINPLILLVSGLALLFFMWCLARFIMGLSNGNEEQVKAGKNCMTWGIVALFVLFSFWGILSILQSSAFGSNIPAPPAGFGG